MTLLGLHFIRPFYLVLLLLVIPLLQKIRYLKSHSSPWEKICSPAILNYLLIRKAKNQSLAPWILFSLSFVLTIIALAGPAWSYAIINTSKETSANAIVLDLSYAMQANDLEPNRLEQAKYLIQDLINQAKNAQFSLIVFSEKAFLLVPLTSDKATLNHFLNSISPSIMPRDGQNIAAGLLKAKEVLQQASYQSGHIFLLSASTPSEKDYLAAKQIANEGMRLSVIGEGSLEGGPIPTPEGYAKKANGELLISFLPEADLKKLAQSAGGEYFSQEQASDKITQLLANQGQIQMQSLNQKAQTWQDEGGKIVLFLLPLAALSFRRGWLSDV